jgi:basic membrane protein A
MCTGCNCPNLQKQKQQLHTRVRMNYTKILLLAAIVIAAVTMSVTAIPARVGFAYTSGIYDVSWTYTHEVARRQLDSATILTNYSVIPVPASQLCDELCMNKTIEFINENNFDLVALAGSAYAPVNYQLADMYPNIKFIQSTAAPKIERPNLSGYLAYIEQTRFLAGIIAGLTSKSGEIGYVTVNRQQQVLRQFNAFVFGIRKVRPDAKIYLISGNKFGDATADRKAADQLLQNATNVDILSFQSLFAEVSRVACERNLSSIGYGSDIGDFVGESVLTSAMWQWVPAYKNFIDQLTAQNSRPFTWNNTVYDGSIAQGAVAMGKFRGINQTVIDIVNSYKQKIISGEELMWCGSDATFIVPNATYLNGDCLSRSQMANAVVIVPNITDFGNADLTRTASPQQGRCWTEPNFDTPTGSSSTNTEDSNEASGASMVTTGKLFVVSLVMAIVFAIMV